MIGIISIFLILLGLYGLITNRHVLKLLVALNVLEVGVNLFIVSVGYGDNLLPPIFTKEVINVNFVDPLPQALVLTSIVIGVGTTALGLAIAKKIYNAYGTYDLNELEGKE